MAESKETQVSVLATTVKGRRQPSSASSSSLMSGHAASPARLTTISDDSDNAESNHTKNRLVRAPAAVVTAVIARNEDVVDVDIDDDDEEDAVVFINRQKSRPVTAAAAVTQPPQPRMKPRDLPESTSTIPSKSSKVAQKRKVSQCNNDDTKDTHNPPFEEVVIVRQVEHPHLTSLPIHIPIPVPSYRVEGSSESKRVRVLPMSMQCDVVALKPSKRSFPSTQRRQLPSVVLHSPLYTTPQDN